MINNGLLAGTLAIVLISGLVMPAYALDALNPGSAGIAGSTSIAQTAQTGQICTLIDLEGLGDLVPIGTIGLATWDPGSVSALDSDVGGSANSANEPSPETVAGSFGTSFTITFSDPVAKASFFYAGGNTLTLNFKGAGGVILDSQNPPGLPLGTIGGDPNGAWDLWAQVSYDAGSDMIEEVEFINTVGNAWLADDFEYCVVAVGGENLPISTTALLLAGLQSSVIWMIPAIVGIAGAGIYLVKFHANKDN